MTLTTDFGSRDSYVAEMKGRLLGECPGVVIVDVTHEVPAHDIACGSYLMERVVPSFPSGTIHVGVVDPGVGTPRAALLAETENAFFVGPDNGLLTPFLDGARLWHLQPDDSSTSATFHGRDIFAPAAGRLAAGRQPAELGLPAGSAARTPEKRDRILHIDHFGNAVTSIRAARLQEGATLRVGSTRIARQVTTYADAPAGEPVFLAGSDGRLEIALREGRAGDVLGLTVGMDVRLEKGER